MRLNLLGHRKEVFESGDDSIFASRTSLILPRKRKFQASLELAGYYQNYIQHYSQYAGPLFQLTKKKVMDPIVMSKEQHQAVVTL